jgi:hypothetical protein
LVNSAQDQFHGSFDTHTEARRAGQDDFHDLFGSPDKVLLINLTSFSGFVNIVSDLANDIAKEERHAGDTGLF